MALALYRKYRPSSFAEIVGQEHVTDPLRVALTAGRINHAYLFSGPRGCGKTSSARILARSLNCVNGPTPDPCGECNSCRGLSPEGSGTVDVVELDAASHGGVDDARELRDRAFYAPAESRYRVFIIDEAHMVTTQGFNALLTIVEEPPEHLVFVFATTEPDKVLPTIRSRTHHYPFRLIPPAVLRGLLEKICTDEGAKVEPAVYPLVIKAGAGSARDTLSVLDQLLSGADERGVTYDRAVSLLGVSDIALIDAIVDGLADDDGSVVFATVDRLTEAGHDPRRFAADLLDRLRDLVLLSAVPDAAERGLVTAPEDQVVTMRAQLERLGPATLSRYAEIVHTGLAEMRGATAPRLLLELLCARMMLPAASESDAAVLQRIERVERHIAMGGSPAGPSEPVAGRQFERPSQRPAAELRPPVPPTPAFPPAAATQPSPRPAEQQPPVGQQPQQPTPASGAEVDALSLRRRWAELLNVVGAQSKSTQAMLMNATVQSVEGETVVLAHASAPLARRLAEARNVDAVAAAMSTLLGGQWQVRCVHGESAVGIDEVGAPVSQRPSAPTRSERAQSPEESAPRRPAATEDVPPPPEPPEQEDIPPPPRNDDPTAEMAEADEFGHPDEPLHRNDPQEILLKLLVDELGARPIDTKSGP
ncbi:MAG: DNA polymerase III subunit gamma and tau [Kutzneria sp.]|nr:DNA polymerase III subunit gamma and tau [Kutzneria sp.]